MKEFFKLCPLFLLFVFSCKDVRPGGDGKVTFTDDMGYELTLETKPKKIVSLAPSITEMIYYLNLDSMLEGVTDYCNYPPDAKKKKSVGNILSPNLEVISQIKPDLVFMTIEGNTKNTYQAVKNLGLNIYVAAPRNIAGIIKMMADIQMICGSENSSERSGERTSKKNKENFIRNINEIRASSDSVKMKALILVSVKPPVTFNKNTFLNDVFLAGGFGNLYDNEPTDYPVLSYEDIIMKNPKYILVITDTTESSRQNILGEILKSMKFCEAVKTGKIFILDEDIFSRPGPRIYDAVKKLKSIN